MTSRTTPCWFAVPTALALIACFVLASPVYAAERRLALVIGNSAYKHEPLVNPGNDARAVAQALRESGFTVTELRNLNQMAMRRAIRDFGDQLVKGGVGLFYYSGHGMQLKGKNYLVPIGNDIQREDEIADQSVDIGLVLEKMRTAGNSLNVVILDACRNNPFGAYGSASAGLAPMDAPARTIIAFSTAPGQVAADGQGDNSVYTQNLVKYMREPGLKLEDVFKRVRTAVRQESRGRQVPWENTSLEADFYFTTPDPRVVAVEQEERRKEQQAAINRAVEEALKRREKDTRDRASIEREVAARVAAERAAIERAAAERIAIAEKETQAAIERAMKGQAPAATETRPQSSPLPVKPAATAGPQPAQPAAAAQAPAKVAVAAPAVATRNVQSPEGLPVVGDSWRYRSTVRDYGNTKEQSFRLTVEAITEAEIRIRIVGGDLLVYNHQWNGLRREYRSGDVQAWEPFFPRFSYPLEPGKTWAQKYINKWPDREVENDSTSTVVGWEDVTVPAGTFKALKVSFATWYRRKDNTSRGQVAINTWSVPEVKRWVKQETLERGLNLSIRNDTTEELLEYKVAISPAVHTQSRSVLADGMVGRIEFRTDTPASQRPLITRSYAKDRETIISGALEIPSSSPLARDGKVPAVILAHGIGGISSERELSWARRLNGWGIASFVVDSYRGRGLEPPVYANNPNATHMVAHVVDIYRALALLATHPRIDTSRVAVMGFSRGAEAAVNAIFDKFRRGALDEPRMRFAAYVAFYPYCNFRHIGRDLLTAPMLMQLGESDEMAEAVPCQNQAEWLRRQGVDIRVVVHSGAHHGFDRVQAVTLDRNFVSVRKCEAEYDIDTFAIRRLDTGASIASPEANETWLRECRNRGARFGGDAAALRASIEEVEHFLRRVFGAR